MSSMAGSAEVVRALATVRQELTPVLRGMVKQVTHEARISARQRAPVRTGTLVDSIQEVYFDDGLTGVVFVAPRDDPNWSGGKYKWLSRKSDKGWLKGRQRTRPAQFPLWIEYGTTQMYSKPFLRPSFRGAVGQFNSRVREVVRRLVEGA